MACSGIPVLELQPAHAVLTRSPPLAFKEAVPLRTITIATAMQVHVAVSETRGGGNCCGMAKLS